MIGTRRWFVLLAVVALGVAACGGDDGGADAVDVTQGDTAEDPGVPDTTTSDDIGPVDPGTPDQGPNPDLVSPDDGLKPDLGVDHGPQACPNPPVTGSTCNEAGACALSCDGEGHEERCLEEADTDAAADWVAARDCLEGAECEDLFVDDSFSVCAQTACGAELGTCFATPDGTCRDIWRCRKECDSGDPGCEIRCFGLGATEVQAVWVLYRTCLFEGECAATDLMENGWPVHTCEQFIQRSTCVNQYQACFPPTT
jgi:hypothetical protein